MKTGNAATIPAEHLADLLSYLLDVRFTGLIVSLWVKRDQAAAERWTHQQLVGMSYKEQRVNLPSCVSERAGVLTEYEVSEKALLRKKPMANSWEERDEVTKLLAAAQNASRLRQQQNAVRKSLGGTI